MKLFILHFRLYLFNAIFTKIPFNFIRMFFARFYMKIGKNSFVAMNVRVLKLEIDKNRIQIGNNCVINPGVLLDGRVGKIVIGDNVDIARDVYIYTAQHDPHCDYHSIKSGDVIIKDYVWIASRATILPNVILEKGSVIACGSVVTKNVTENTVVGGIPAKVIGVRKSNLQYIINYQPPFYT
ncbi:acyltransferase [Flavobacterium johnsoniae]|jgi:maltose O-acetyltransferase|uniref:acyltransferase n=1 Tax=Flavobacterium johnsoniae TaxID=986 RepID=UPI003202B15B